MSELQGKVAVVTGGAAGIGEGSARQLARLGCDIAIADINPETGRRLAQEIEGWGRRCVFLEADMSDAETCLATVARAGEALGRIDVLINNLGGVKFRPFMDQTPHNWRRLIDFNLTSTLAATHAAVGWMRRGGAGGAIVNVASTEALRGAPGVSIYAACKAAMVELTKTLALELSGDGIRVNCIAPDHIATPGLAGFMPTDPESLAKRDLHVPLGRMASLEEAGDVVAFLASPRSSFVTGVTIPVDGGITAASGWRRDAAGAWTL